MMSDFLLAFRSLYEILDLTETACVSWLSLISVWQGKGWLLPCCCPGRGSSFPFPSIGTQVGGVLFYFWVGVGILAPQKVFGHH